MTQTEQTWQRDWPNALREAVHSLGFSSLTDALAAMPGRPYGEVANRLGNVAPIQVIAIQFREARQSGRVRDAAKDSLCRNLVERLPNGWRVGEKSDWQSVLALSSWSSEIKVTGECPELESTLFAVSSALRATPPPTGWIPLGPHDRIIESAFDLHWPIRSERA